MKFEFLLERHPSKPAQNLVINSNDRFHFRPEAKMVKNLRLIARAEVGLNVKPVFSPNRPCKVIVTVYGAQIDDLTHQIYILQLKLLLMG